MTGAQSWVVHCAGTAFLTHTLTSYLRKGAPPMGGVTTTSAVSGPVGMPSTAGGLHPRGRQARRGCQQARPQPVNSRKLRTAAGGARGRLGTHGRLVLKGPMLLSTLLVVPSGLTATAMAV